MSAPAPTPLEDRDWRPDAPLPPAGDDGPRPFVMRGLVAHWPLVRSAENGVAALHTLKRFDVGKTVAVNRAPAAEGGRIFYTADMRAPNVTVSRESLLGVLDELAARAAEDDPPLVYVASTTMDSCLPGLSDENPLDFGDKAPLGSIWIGNRSRIAPHYDLPHNVACVAVGRRRFTLFPPEQIENLYVGPIENTPAGQPVSLVDPEAPDLDRFPRFAEALRAAYVAELEPGDAIFIPSMWWHHVVAHDPVNVLMNYWWRDVPAHFGSPATALTHAMMTLRGLPPEQKRIWRTFFDYYVFSDPARAAAHIPDHARGILGPMDDDNARRIRTYLLNMLNR